MAARKTKSTRAASTTRKKVAKKKAVKKKAAKKVAKKTASRGRPPGAVDTKPRTRRPKAIVAVEGGTRKPDLPDAQRLLKADADKREREAEKLRLQLEEMHGNLVPRDKVAQQWADRVEAVRREFCAIPERMAQKLAAETDPRRIRRLLLDEVEEVCTRFAGSG